MAGVDHHAMSNLSKEKLHALPGVSPKDPETNGFMLQQTMLRIKDPKPSLEFYTKALGMVLFERLDFKDMVGTFG